MEVEKAKHDDFQPPDLSVGMNNFEFGISPKADDLLMSMLHDLLTKRQ